MNCSCSLSPGLEAQDGLRMRNIEEGGTWSIVARVAEIGINHGILISSYFYLELQ